MLGASVVADCGLALVLGTSGVAVGGLALVLSAFVPADGGFAVLPYLAVLALLTDCSLHAPEPRPPLSLPPVGQRCPWRRQAGCMKSNVVL